MIKYHKGLTLERWARFFFEKMANVYVEVARAIDFRNRGEKELSNQAFYRALELLDLTIETERNYRSRRRELCRVRELLVDYFAGDNVYGSSDELWESYFYPLALAAGKEREKKRQVRERS